MDPVQCGVRRRARCDRPVTFDAIPGNLQLMLGTPAFRFAFKLGLPVCPWAIFTMQGRKFSRHPEQRTILVS